MAEPQIPRVNDLLGAGFDAIATARPTTVRHLAFGQYGDVMHGWKAQAQLVLRRLAHEAKSTRLICDGRPLLDLLASEFDAILDPSPQHAIGTVVLRRSFLTAAEFTGGIIRAGTKFRRPADPTATPQARGALFESTEPVYVGTDSTVAPPPSIGRTQRVVVPIRAVTSGAAGNIPRAYSSILSDDASPLIEIADTLFDPAFSVVYGDAAGGSDQPQTARLRALGKALGSGQYGPNEAAIMAGLLLTNGVAHAAVRESATTGTIVAWIADESWAWSSRLRDLALQNLNDTWLGFGCAAAIGATSMTPVGISAAVTVRDKRAFAETSGLTEKIRASVRTYFNDRPDWYAWRESGIKGAIMRADRRLLEVTSVTVKGLDGAVISQSSGELPTTTVNPLVYRYVDDTNISVVLSSPS